MGDESLKHKTKVGLYWSSIAQFSNIGLSFVVGIIMARLLSPSDFGIVALPAIFITVGNVIIEGGFTQAMVRKPNLDEPDLSTAFIYSSSVGLVCYLLIFGGAPWIADFYKAPILVPLVRITALCFLWGPWVTPQNIILQRRLDFKTRAKISVCTRIIGSALGIYFAYVGYGLWALVITSVVSSLLTTVATWMVVKWVPKTGWCRASFQYLWGYGNKMVGVSLINQLYLNFAPLLIGKFFSVKELGIYNRATQYSDLPSQQVTGVIGQVTFPVLSKMQDDDEALAKNYRRMLKVSSFVIFPMMTLLAALSKPLILFLLTDKWEDAIILLQILCFASMWYPVHALNLNLLEVKGRSDLFFRLELYKKAVFLIVMACSLPFGLIWFVSSSILTSFISLFINTYYTGKLIGIGFIQQMKDLFLSYLLSCVAFIVTIWVLRYIVGDFLQIIVGGIIGIVFYLSGAFLFKMEELQDIKYLLNRQG